MGRTRVSGVDAAAPAAAGFAPVAENPIVAVIGVVHVDTAARRIARIVRTHVVVVAIKGYSAAGAVGALIVRRTDAEVVAGIGVIREDALVKLIHRIVRTFVAVVANIPAGGGTFDVFEDGVAALFQDNDLSAG